MHRNRVQPANLGLHRAVIASALACCATVAAYAGEPFVPADADTVLYEMPLALRQQRNAVAAARRAWAEDPTDLDKSCNVAGADFRLGQATGDPRFYGYARAALAPWWDDPDAPAQALAIRAKLKEIDHDYAGAVADLEALLTQEPSTAKAWIELANIQRVRGDYDAAGLAVDRLAAFAPDVTVALARIPLLAVTGELAQADEQFAALRPTVEREYTGAMPWLLVMQAQLARALGEPRRAETYYRQALAAGIDTGYLRRSYADLLLMQERFDAALALCADHTNDTGLLLRAALAARGTGDDGQAAQWADEIERRFDEIRLRGGTPHGRYEARYLLEVRNDPQRALTVALENWGRQREQLDARHVLSAALAAREPDAAEPVLSFLAEHGTEDAELQALIDQLKALP